MKAAVIHAFGQPPRFEDFPEPTVGEGEVGVNVRAAGLHPVVRAQASGSQSGRTNVLPQIPGIDGVGSLDDGTRVYFDKVRPPYGTMAERCVVLRERIFPIPDRLDDVTAAALFNPGLTSWLAFTRAQLTKGGNRLDCWGHGSCWQAGGADRQTSGRRKSHRPWAQRTGAQ